MQPTDSVVSQHYTLSGWPSLRYAVSWFSFYRVVDAKHAVYQSIFIKSFATRWDHWLAAKLFSGMGVGMLQSNASLPVSLWNCSHSAKKIFHQRVFSVTLTHTYFFFFFFYLANTLWHLYRLTRWFVLGQLFASVALNRLSATDPYHFRTPIYTQVGDSFRSSAFVWHRNLSLLF